ncbi:hypothetical protein NC651_003738 [Populus alba x Populus x berolinensis]|nr:hypothetical protein NC651_003735 [Populus alba x Populus x berolinensis]KAJ6949849.1 hypothetical protein NC651_003738 [Populus alba x Populus x berolinensis]
MGFFTLNLDLDFEFDSCVDFDEGKGFTSCVHSGVFSSIHQAKVVIVIHVIGDLSSGTLCTTAMTSSLHDLSDNSEADEQQKESEPQIQSSSPAMALAHPGFSTPNVQYATPQLGAGHAMAPAAYPYPDPYYRSIFAPYDPQPYPPQPYGAQPMVIYLLISCQDHSSWSRKSRF